MNLGLTLAAFLLALGILIVVHELGHYGMARLCGVRVLRFSVGFGKPLLKFVLGADRTEWVVCALPLGGYVKMLDEREGLVAPQELHRAFNRQSVWRRFAIVAAGPLANFLLAVLLYWLLFVGGVKEAKPLISAPATQSAAAAAGLQRGDLIRSVDGQPVLTWQETRWHLIQAALAKPSVKLEVLNVRNELSWHTLEFAGFSMDETSGDPLARLGLMLYRPDVPAVIGRLLPGEAAEKAGLKPDDRVLTIDGRAVENWEAFVNVIRNNAGRELSLAIDRGGNRLEFAVTPQASNAGNGEPSIGRIGASARIPESEFKNLSVVAKYGVTEALSRAITKTWQTSEFSLRMMGKMLTGGISWRNLSGPITIADYAGQSAQLGLAPYLSFLALISVSLFVLNLLPIPLLDGGHLMYYMIEIIKGSPVSERVMELGQKVGMTVLLILMAFAFYNDIHRAFSG